MLVALSGVFRVHIASLLLRTNLSMFTCIAGGFVIYSVYTLDRTLDSEEDLINKHELNGSIKEIGLLASGITFIIGCLGLAKTGAVIFAFLPVIIGFLYSKGIKIGKLSLKLKGGLGMKNIVVGLIWGTSIVGVAGCGCENLLSVFLVFLFFEIKLFNNSVIYDIKDIEGDLHAGIKTLPVSLGILKTRRLLFGLHVLSHFIIGLSIIKGVLVFEPLIIFYSFICGLICIQNYTKSNYQESPISDLIRTVLVDGESTLSIGLRTVFSIL
jgi:4-hydroxybenzoate polyprenyltransferase